MAWGFDKLFAEMKVKDAPALRAEMRDYLGSKGQYYRYKLGQLKLLPEQQAYIKQLFAKYGYKDVEFDHFSEEIDFTKANLFLCPPDDPAMPFKRSHREQVTGYR